MFDSDDYNKIALTTSKILAICMDNNISMEDACVIDYFHNRIKFTNSLNLAEDDPQMKDFLMANLGLLKTDDEELNLASENLMKATKNFDQTLRDAFGHENALTSRLRRFLNLYIDKTFYEKIKNYYFLIITPNLPHYDQFKIDNAFKTYYKKFDEKDDIDELLSSIQ